MHMVYEIVLEWTLILLTGNLWDTENGPAYGDEINLVNPGFNSGWQQIYGILENWTNSWTCSKKDP